MIDEVADMKEHMKQTKEKALKEAFDLRSAVDRTRITSLFCK
jgi:hypothetical protein